MKNEYEAPKVITYSEDEIIDMLGPAKPAHQVRVQRINKKISKTFSKGGVILLWLRLFCIYI